MEARPGMFSLSACGFVVANLPSQNLVFAKDEAKFAAKKINNKFTGGLSGREPQVESETGK